MEWAGRVVESVTGRRLGDFMAEHVLEPSGVRDITSVISFHLRV